MTNKKLFIYSIVSFLIFIAALFSYSFTQSQPEAATTKETYLIVRTGLEGIEGIANDNTGVYISQEDLNGLEVVTGDEINVTFADYETILKVEKVN